MTKSLFSIILVLIMSISAIEFSTYAYADIENTYAVTSTNDNESVEKEKTIDYTELQNIMEIAGVYLSDDIKEIYTNESVSNLENKYNDAKELLENIMK